MRGELELHHGLAFETAHADVAADVAAAVRSVLDAYAALDPDIDPAAAGESGR